MLVEPLTKELGGEKVAVDSSTLVKSERLVRHLSRW